MLGKKGKVLCYLSLGLLILFRVNATCQSKLTKMKDYSAKVISTFIFQRPPILLLNFEGLRELFDLTVLNA